MVNEVYVPMLTNPHNQKSWPEVVKKDTERQLQNLRNNIDEVNIRMNFIYKIFVAKLFLNMLMYIYRYLAT